MNWPVVIWVLAVTLVAASALLMMAGTLLHLRAIEKRLARLGEDREPVMSRGTEPEGVDDELELLKLSARIQDVQRLTRENLQVNRERRAIEKRRWLGQIAALVLISACLIVECVFVVLK